MLPTIAREPDAVVMIDQRKLPKEEIYVRCKTAPEVARAIKTMVIRGAPAIGVAAAMGIALGIRNSKVTGTQKLAAEFHKTCDLMAATRPTAVNLFWAIERMKRTFAAAAQAGESVAQIKDRLDNEAQAIHDDDVASCRALGGFGAEIVPAEARVLTHCNAGALMHQGKVNLVVVGADRIAANGDTANKIGTYAVAVLAREHQIPFYVAAPRSTIDLDTPSGGDIPIEERNAREVTHVGAAQVAPDGALVWNPAFDVTPHHLIAGIITECGILRPPYSQSLKQAKSN